MQTGAMGRNDGEGIGKESSDCQRVGSARLRAFVFLQQANGQPGGVLELSSSQSLPSWSSLFHIIHQKPGEKESSPK